MTDPFIDPGDPGELKGNIRAGDLLNLPCLFRVTGEGEWPAKEAFTDETGKQHRAQPPSPYVECDVAILGADGIEDYGSGVRISWARVVPAQLSMEKVGKWVPARAKKDPKDNSVSLWAFDVKGKARAAELLPEVEALFAGAQVTEALGATEVDPDTEPF